VRVGDAAWNFHLGQDQQGILTIDEDKLQLNNQCIIWIMAFSSQHMKVMRWIIIISFWILSAVHKK
jgi:hypothetical protein